MKYFLLVSFILSTVYSFSQKTLIAYIEVRGNVDVLGNIYVNPIIKPKKLMKADSLIDYAQINRIINLSDPIKIINKLSEIGWTLVTVAHVSGDKDNIPASPFMLYYFRKDYEL